MKNNNNKDLKVGDKLYTSDLKEITITKIGKKYLYTDDVRGNRYPVVIETLVGTIPNHSTYAFQLYRNKEARALEIESGKLRDAIQSHCSWSSGKLKENTVEELREAVKVLKINLDNK